MYLLFFSLNNIIFLPIKKEIKECEKEIKEGRGGGGVHVWIWKMFYKNFGVKCFTIFIHCVFMVNRKYFQFDQGFITIKYLKMLTMFSGRHFTTNAALVPVLNIVNFVRIMIKLLNSPFTNSLSL